MTSPVLQTLRNLQAIDEKRLALEARKVAIPETIAAQTRAVANIERKIAEHTELIKKDQVGSHNQEMEMQGHLDVIDKLKGQLNTAGSNKEYTAIQHQIETKRMELRNSEDSAFELLTDTEDLLVAETKLEAELAEKVAALNDLKQHGEEEIRTIDGELAVLHTSRDEVTAALDPPILQKYDRILDRNHGDALAAVIDGACQGCHMTVNPQEINTLLGGLTIVFCRSCNRILHLPDTEAE